ncbi:hypothetical protein PSYPI_42100, partial [Pseudomonas syringae pv. pisi str. 1704B]
PRQSYGSKTGYGRLITEQSLATKNVDATERYALDILYRKVCMS